MHDDNCFLTLTYADEKLPAYGSLDRDAVPKFMKRLRKSGVKARYFQCGEYGDKGRPHYHVCLFGHAFPDREYARESKAGFPLYRSPALERLWRDGFSDIGDLTFESAAYCARYVMKKITGARAEEHYARVDEETGEVVYLEPEYATMSRNPGLGASWFERFRAEVYPSDTVLVRGRLSRPPRYYDSKLGDADLAAIRARRFVRSLDGIQDRSAARLSVREVCAEARISQSPRSLE